jgi:hypothetical protein
VLSSYDDRSNPVVPVCQVEDLDDVFNEAFGEGVATANGAVSYLHRLSKTNT